MIDAPLAWCRGLNAEAFPLVPGAGHPYVETARQLLAEGDTAYRDTPLRRYYESYQPRSAADRLGAPLAGPTVSAPAEVASMPWHTPRSEGDAIRRRAVLRAENRAHGAALDHSHGFMDFGPVSEAKGALAVTRLKRLLGRISEEGFQLMPGRSGLCRAQILISGDAYRAVLSIGQHRAAALAALGGETIPFWPLPNPVRREEVMLWPGVRAGAYSRDAALAVFDRVFAGRQPPGLEASRFVHGAPAAPVRRTHSG